MISAVGSFDQEKPVAITGVQAVDSLFGQDNPKGITNFANLKLKHFICDHFPRLSKAERGRLPESKGLCSTQRKRLRFRENVPELFFEQPLEVASAVHDSHHFDTPLAYLMENEMIGESPDLQDPHFRDHRTPHP